MKLNIKAFALACGILWGLGLFFLTWWLIALDGATGEITWIGRLYRGYNISPIRQSLRPGLGVFRRLDRRRVIRLAL